MSPPAHLFAMYRGDEFLDVGTAVELAERWNVHPDYIRRMSTPAHRRRMKGGSSTVSRARYTVKLGAPDEDDL